MTVHPGRRVFITGALGALGLALAGCTARPNAAPSAPVAAPSPSPTITAIPRYPLTGLPLNAATADGPSLAAKIGNDEIARPQIGLEHADIIFEEYVEGGLTRYVAIWHSTVPELLGPLRSIRPMDPAILTSFGGIIAYSGGLVPFVQAMRDSGLYNAIHGQSDTAHVMYRSTDKPAPHNVILRAQQLVAEQSALDAPAAQFSYARSEFSETASALSGPAISGVTATFSAIRRQSWNWNEARGVFERSQQGLPDPDASGTPRSAVNVIGLIVDVHNGYADVPETVLNGSGTAIVCAGGHAVDATWTKSSNADPLVLTAADGSSILLEPGNTWVELIPAANTAELATIPA